MNPQTTSVILAVSDYWLLGSMPKSTVRLRDLLLRDDTDFFPLNNVHVFRSDIRESPLATLCEIVIPKKKIVWVGVWEAQHEAPEQRFYNFQSKAQSTAAVVVEKYLIEGIVHLSRKTNNVPFALHREGGQFCSMTKATVRFGHSEPLISPFVLVNNERASVFGLPAIGRSASQEQRPAPLSGVHDAAEDVALGLYKNVKHLVDECNSATTTVVQADFANPAKEHSQF